MVATATYQVSASAWTDLGAGPLLVEASQTTYFVISDAMPGLTDVGFVNGADKPLAIQTSSHVWARGVNGPSVVEAAPITSVGGGSGSGGTVAQGAPGTQPWLVSWSNQSVMLGAGSATFGSIANTAFGISGTLPAFASPPTINLGTLNGVALDTSVQAVKTALGSPFQANGSIGNTVFGATQSGTWSIGVNNFPSTQAVSAAAGSFVDGADATQGTKADTATTGAGITTAPFSIVALLKGIYNACVGATPAGANFIGLIAHSVTALAGGVSTFARLTSSAASTNATLVKSSAARLYKARAYNTTGSPIRLKLYNKATAPVPGTDTPFDVLVLSAGYNSFDMTDLGWSLSAGLGYALTTGSADTDATAVAAGAVTDLVLGYA